MTLQYYMVNAIGFALQLVPAMFIVLRPFGGKRYRVPRRAILAALAVYGAVVSLAFPLVTCYVDVIDSALLGNFYLLAVALVFAVVLVNADFIERMGPKSCVLKDGREVLLSWAAPRISARPTRTTSSRAWSTAWIGSTKACRPGPSTEPSRSPYHSCSRGYRSRQNAHTGEVFS